MRIFPSLLVVASLGFAGCAGHKSKTSAAGGAKGQRMTVRTTSYTHTEAGGSNNAIGGRLRFGGKEFSAASDWSWMPLGTRFKMLSNSREYVIEDYGSALVGRKTIDLYFPSRSSMRAWGVRNEEIEILEWGSEPMSLKLLAPRTRNGHVATMVAQLRKAGVVPAS